MPEFEDEEIQLPPHSVEAEQAVIGSALVAPSSLIDTGKILKPGDFYGRQHQIIWASILDLWEKLEPIDILTVSQKLKDSKQLEKVGGRAYITDLASAIATTANARWYAERLREDSNKRQLIKIIGDAKTKAYDGKPLEEIISDLITKTGQIEKFTSRQRVMSLGEVMPLAMKELERRQQNRDKIPGVPTGLYHLDEKIWGFNPGELILLAARPSMGKTAMALNIAMNVSVHYGLPVLFVSLEMNKDQLAFRLLASKANFNARKFKTGDITQWELENELHKHAQGLSGLPFDVIDDSMGVTSIDDLISVIESQRRAKNLKKGEKPYALIVIDYIQLMESLNQENRVLEISEISRKAKKLAAYLEVPVLALSQCSRMVEQRQNKRPMLSDLRESGSLEQDASIVMFIYRDEVYNPNSGDKGMAEIIIAKNRDGETATVPQRFRADRQRFESVGHENDFWPKLYGTAEKVMPKLLDETEVQETLTRWESEGGERNVTAKFVELSNQLGDVDADAAEILLRNHEALGALWDKMQAAQVVAAPPIYNDLDIFTQI